MALQTAPYFEHDTAPIETLESYVQSAIGLIEGELHKSEIYQQIVTVLQRKLGEASEEIQALLKSLSRQAIDLTLQKLVGQSLSQFNAGQPQAQHTVDNAGKLDEHGLPQPTMSAASTSPTAAIIADLHAVIDSNPPSVKRNGKATASSEPALFQASRAVSSRKEKPKEKLPTTRAICLQELGQKFRQIREAKQMSLEQLHELTRIPIHQIRALEAGQVDRLPEGIYIQGFIRLLSKALGLDGNQILQSLPPADPSEGLLPSWAMSTPAPESPFCLRTMHLYVGYAALVVGAAGGLNYLSQQRTEPVPPAPQFIPDQTVPQTQKSQIKQTGLPMGAQIAPPELLSVNP
jgi:transcriptional regulator with XRE-family HTH domain